ncbi:hypothetical protein [Enterobacter roggenkampii]|uniref:hypothetical protein n=1 Tax=Enterobacter roggenkampii TaxID=1812935 RepID=UPI003D6F43EB
MDSKKTVSYRVTNCENCTFTGNMSYGSDVGFEITDSKGIIANENRHYSEQVLNAYHETMKLVHESSNEIIEKVGNKNHNEIIKLLDGMVRSQSKSPLEYMEMLNSCAE